MTRATIQWVCAKDTITMSIAGKYFARADREPDGWTVETRAGDTMAPGEVLRAVAFMREQANKRRPAGCDVLRWEDEEWIVDTTDERTG